MSSKTKTKKKVAYFDAHAVRLAKRRERYARERAGKQARAAELLELRKAAEADARAPIFDGPFQFGAHLFLDRAQAHIADKAPTRDSARGERSMGRTVAAFNALTGHHVSERDGWLFMAALKLARITGGAYNADSFEDGAAYIALAGESASKAAMDEALEKFYAAGTEVKPA